MKDATGYKAYIYNRPYERAVSIVKALGDQTSMSPNAKMDLINKISKSIIEEIDLYYKWRTPELQEHGDLLMAIPEVKRSKLTVDADTLLMITIYVLTQS